jgi:hypothetical protein
MEPTIVAGDQLVMGGTARPRRGEVWAFCTDTSEVVAHRCRGWRGTSAVFQGDAARRPDAPAAVSQLIGRVVAVERAGRTRRLGAWDRWTGELRSRVRLHVRRVWHGLRRRLRERFSAPA